MATHLYRIGRWAYLNKFKMIAIWLLVLVGMGVAAATLSKPTSESFSIPGIPSEKAQNQMIEAFPEKPKFDENVSVKYVIKAPDGSNLTEPQYQSAINTMVEQMKQFDGVKAPEESIANPFDTFGTQQNPGPGRDAIVQYQEQTFGKTPQQAQADAQASSPINSDATIAQLGAAFDVEAAADVSSTAHTQMEDVANSARASGLTVEMSGTALPQPAIGFTSELIGMGVGAIVMILTFASLVAWGMPLITALVGVIIGMLGVTAATFFFDLSSETPILATMIGLAVGIDYALFIVSRYRHEVHTSKSRAEAAGKAVGTAGSAVVFAGATVFIALAALFIVNIPFLTAMGLAAAGTVLVAVLVALTLLPAILGIFGNKVFAGRLKFLNPPDVTPHDPARRHNGQRWVNQVVKRPAIFVIGSIVILGLLAIPIGGLKLGLPNDGNGDPSTTQRKAYDLVAEGFGPGQNNPFVVVADGSGIADEGQRIEAFNGLVNQIKGVDDVATAVISPGDLNESKDTAIISVLPASASGDDATQQLVKDLRGLESSVTDRTGLTYGVTGQTAIEIDVSDQLSSALIPYLIVVVGLAFILLMIVFRSILVPLTAALGFLLSIGATFGATVAIFTNGDLGLVGNPQPLVSFLPIILIGIVFGLAMDYQVFLVSRMREAYVHGTPAKEAVVSGFSQSARVVAAAAAIMVSVFAAFMLQDMVFIKAIGFALAAAVIFDAFIVRMTLIPAVLAMLGDKAWWLPKWLDKILPNVDIEGEKLNKTLAAEQAESDERVASKV
ncbi:MMPL family transporter [Williamsia soli]|uniref:MMPL family transporter n=1 Tax=Williamsia soli TaxID=364929 RepID=UPI001A9FC7F7|nr:MMPL family transporter [Williamsia soli]